MSGPQRSRKAPDTSGVKTASEDNVGALETALGTAASSADWLEVSDVAALELARHLARLIDREADPHAARTLLQVLDSLGLTVKGRRDRQPAEEDSPLARLQAAARRQLDAAPRDARLKAAE
jgi:hypothetical protein